MKLSSLLDADCILTRAKVSSKQEAIRLVLGRFVQQSNFDRSLKEIEQAIFEREEIGGTVLDNGFAIPHARLDNFNDFLVGIVIPEIPFTDKEGKQIRFMVVSLSSKTGSTVYLQMLSSFVQIVKDDSLYERVLASQNAAELLQTIENVYVKKDLTVKDIMSTKLVTADASSTLKELADIFYSNGVGYAPVVDAAGKVIGEVNVNDLLRVGLPHYAVQIGNLDFLTHFEPFETLLANEDKIKVESIMRKVERSLGPETSIIETALEMAKYNRRHLPVVEEKVLKGIVSYMDILSKVLRF